MANGELLGLLAMAKWPAAVAGGVGGLAIILGAFGFGIKTPGKNLADFKESHAVEHVTINDTLAELGQYMESQQELIEAMVRGECIENPIEDLQRQGLSQKCVELGIQR